MLELGVSWIRIGLESQGSNYGKLKGADAATLTHELRSHGIKLLGLHHRGTGTSDAGKISDEIEHAISQRNRLPPVQLYTPIPGTPLYFEMEREGRLLADVELADIHGRDKFNFRHAGISRDDSKRFLDDAFRRDSNATGRACTASVAQRCRLEAL